MGWPLYSPFPPSQGAVSFLEPGSALSKYRPVAAVAIPSGMDAADSNDRLGGNYIQVMINLLHTSEKIEGLLWQ